MDSINSINFTLDILSSIRGFHSKDSSPYKYIDSILKSSVEDVYGKGTPCKAILGYLGEIALPYFEMGAINSTHLFGLDEFIIFSFYKFNSSKYKRVADLGANIGLHSIVLSNLGYAVSCYEPDPIHIENLKENIEANCSSNMPIIHEKAVSVLDGLTEFTRVVGNTTGSHITGSKQAPYGQLVTFEVGTKSFKDIVLSNDLLKIDVEGHEADIICSTTSQDWKNTDAIVEVGSEENAVRIYEHLRKESVNLFSQVTSWEKVTSEANMPKSYKEGSLFISKKDAMPWS